MSSTSAPRSRRLALTVLCAGMLMIILDGGIVTVALPAIQQDLRFSSSSLTWTVNAYMIAFGGLLLLAGRLGDLLGRRRMFVTGLAVFTVASIGQVLGGVLTDALSWHWVFLINLPIGVAAVLLAVLVLENDRGIGLGKGADALGALLVTGGVMLGVYAIVQTEQYGWTSGRTLGFAALALALIAGFAARQATAARPLLPLRVFRSRNVWGANLIQMLMLAAMFSFQILIALYMQNVLGYGASATGLAMLPAALAIGVLSLGFSARLVTRFGERTILLAGLVLLLAGRLLLVRVPVDGAYAVDLLPAMLLAGGFGLAMPALTALGMSGTRPGDAGVASGLFNTTQQIGAALGVAALSTLAASRTEHLAAGGQHAASALTGGFQLAFGIGAGLLTAAIVLTVLVLRKPATGGESAETTAPAAEAAVVA
ncbi:MFS family permease [Streptosporangium album]|uniref:MFS family permease n=1 Tax=Streptosporangium album TaxID=47479 RepID=A0A7W7RWQ3_9ACTN|nr:MFS transporter [Streptosporangium album]MBB4939322.1 MFS family permease [Streptosporangium album]